MNKPCIAVTPLYDNDQSSIWMLPNYMDAITEAGGIPVILPLHISQQEIMELMPKFDGFLFTGGQDINPALYGEEKMAYCGELNSARDSMESILFQEALKQDKPVLGICRGLQFMNVALGGTLYQDIKEQRQPAIEITHRQEDSYGTPCHLVSVFHNSPLFEIVKKDSLQVNSLHHQAIKDLSPQLKACAVSDDDLIEAVYLPNKKFVLGVQWHPEFLYKTDADSINLFRKLIDSCR